ncbi:MAG: GGDEF domain-containing response regulator [Massilia sp.]|nr:GGDEF domain-containing response regulator [Massilia sp.]
MTPPLRVLVVADPDDDALLIMRALRCGALDIVTLRVADSGELAAALAQRWDVVIAAWLLRSYSGIEALTLCRAHDADMRFILIVDPSAGQTAALAAGASDYVIKGKVAPLVAAILRPLSPTVHTGRQRSTAHETERDHAVEGAMAAKPGVAAIKRDSGHSTRLRSGWSRVFAGAEAIAAGALRGGVPHERQRAPNACGLDVRARGVAGNTTGEIAPPGAASAFWKHPRFPFAGASKHRFLRQFTNTIARLRQSDNTPSRLADHDPLTDVSNRRSMLDRLARAVDTSARSGRHGALLFFNLDHFKRVNDTHGHQAGDQLLRQSAERLKACVRAQDTLARSGGDEFVIVLESLSCALAEATIEVDVIARNMLAVIKVPYPLDVGRHQLTASIGIALFDNVAHTPDALIKRAGLALGGVKRAGGGGHRFFEPAMQTRSTLRDALKADLREGLDGNHFELHYQPQVDGDGRMTGVEALLRLRHPDKGLIMPGPLIGVAEETGMITELGHWMLGAACRQLAAWASRAETAHLSMAVNVSARQFRDPALVSQVLQTIERSGANPCRLILELTESVLLDDIDATIAKMVAMRQAGLRFSLDDFGTGYSSLAYLKHLPLYEVKIDRSFVHDIVNDASNAAIVGAIITLANNLGLVIVAEGVEDVAQWNYLASNGCTRFQGYLFGRPVPIAMLDIHR